MRNLFAQRQRFKILSGKADCLVILLWLLVPVAPTNAAQTLLSYHKDQPETRHVAQVQPATSTAQRYAPTRRSEQADLSAERAVFRGNLAEEVPEPEAEVQEPEADSWRLAPSPGSSLGSTNGDPSKPNLNGSKSPFALPVGQLLSTAGAGLAIVVGLFLVCTWLWRGDKHNPNAALPQEVFSVLGRATLVGRTTTQLIRVGNKLVLVAVTAEGLQPLTEITDPAEVDRLAGLCLGGASSSSTAEFQKVLRRIAQEPASGFLGGEAT